MVRFHSLRMQMRGDGISGNTQDLTSVSSSWIAALGIN